MREQKYTVSFIDQGYCFNAGEWTFPDHPLRGVFARNEVYESVRGWEAFEPWLSAIVEDRRRSGFRDLAGEVPPEWYGGEWGCLERLAEQLIERRKMVRELIAVFRMSARKPFPNWKEEEREGSSGYGFGEIPGPVRTESDKDGAPVDTKWLN